MTTRSVAIALTALLLPGAVGGAERDEIENLRRELDALRADYELRLRALEARLRAAEAAAAPEAGAAGTGGAPAAQRRALSSSDLNPALSVVLQGSINNDSRDPDDYALSGFQLGDEAGLAAEGLTLDETEITASASVDPLFYAEATVGLHDDGEDAEVEVEQAFFEPLALPAGLGGRFGRFYSGVGYLNRFHSHAWDFHDAPLANRAFLGEQYRDDGLRLSWTAPTDIYLLLGAEALAGRQFPGGRSESVKGDVQTLFVKLGGDLGASHAWQAGLSGLFADVNDREAGGHDHDAADTTTVFSGDSRLLIADLVWKWTPSGNPRRRNVTFQSEYFYRDEDGEVSVQEGPDAALLDYDGEQTGWYAQAVYQFMPRWRIGLRYDRLDPDNGLRISDPGGFTDPDEVLAASGLETLGNPKRWSTMVDWSPSEFSRLRAQYNRDESTPGRPDDQWSLQYIMSLGAHGAHEF